MRIGVVGGGPAGLSFALFAKTIAPSWHISVWERIPDSTAGFGLVLPSRTIEKLAEWDPPLGRTIRRNSTNWDRIDIHYRGDVISSAGHEYRALSRSDLVAALYGRLRDLGVAFHFGEVAAPATLAAEVDVLVAADGSRSAIREQLASRFRPQLRPGRCRFIWMRMDARVDAFNFHVVETDRGAVCVQAYPYSDQLSTVIVEMREETLRRHHDGAPEPVAGHILPEALTRTLRAALGPGHLHAADSSGWQTFTNVYADRWVASNVVLIGDAAHAAHFSIGSGTKLALEDARCLADCLAADASLEALRSYERTRRSPVAALQEAAASSQRWFEDLASHLCPDPLLLAQRLLTRSGRMSEDRLGLRRYAQT